MNGNKCRQVPPAAEGAEALVRDLRCKSLSRSNLLPSIWEMNSSMYYDMFLAQSR